MDKKGFRWGPCYLRCRQIKLGKIRDKPENNNLMHKVDRVESLIKISHENSQLRDKPVFGKSDNFSFLKIIMVLYVMKLV